MNKTMLCIEILQLLSAKEIMSKNELAEILEINPRNVIEYIKTLVNCGYDIQSVRGIYGGYHLNKDFILPATKLAQKEVDVLKMSCNFLEHQPDFLDYKAYVKTISKVLCTNIESFATDLTIIDRYPLAMSKEELFKRYTLFVEAQTSHRKCEILYLSSKNKESKHIIHPYQTFIFNGSWLVLAWNETVNDFGYFKLNRMQDIKVTSQRFTISKTYHRSNYIDQFGMKLNGDYYNIKLELKGLYTVVSERIYGKNQKITRIDEDTTILECGMQNKNIITNFVLGFGSKVKVLEPLWLKDRIREEAKQILGGLEDE